MNIIILGDKYEKGMKSKGCQALMPYSARVLMVEHQIKQLHKACSRINNIVYVYGLDAKQFTSANTKYDIIKIYNPNYIDTNYAYSLCEARKFLDDNCLIIFGDTKLDKVNLKYLKLDFSCVFTDNSAESKLGYIENQGNVINIAYDLPFKINDKIFYLSKNDAIKIQKLLENSQHHNNFIFELINKIIDDDSTVRINKRTK